jgi:HPt (histidine-containing phosphotransfer) domain-containing protein
MTKSPFLWRIATVIKKNNNLLPVPFWFCSVSQNQRRVADMSIEIPDEVRIKYFERRKTDVQKCTEAIANKDFKFLQKVGHDLKGNALTFGFEPLAAIGENLENAAIEQNIDTARDCVTKMNTYLNTISLAGTSI